ncbi:MAG: hypothetical protein ACI81P_001982 [Neolewinella sp.]|jgi:hypothetical protein
MLPISTYLNETSTFTYELSIRINSKTYIDRIIAFERAFLTLGEEYGFFVAVPFKTGIHLSLEPLLEKYEKERYLSLEQRKTEAVTLLNFTESKYLRNRVAYVGLDVRGAEFTDGEPVAPLNFSDEEQLRSAQKMMELVTITGPLYEDLMDEFYWEEYLKVRIRSSANVWLETLPADEENATPEQDNRAVAGRVVPVFNSYLRALRALVEAEHGGLTLVDTFSDQVTEAGVLLGGKVVFE